MVKNIKIRTLGMVEKHYPVGYRQHGTLRVRIFRVPGAQLAHTLRVWIFRVPYFKKSHTLGYGFLGYPTTQKTHTLGYGFFGYPKIGFTIPSGYVMFRGLDFETIKYCIVRIFCCTDSKITYPSVWIFLLSDFWKSHTLGYGFLG